METFSIRDLRERTGELVRAAEDGKLSVVAKHGHPVFLAVPISELMLTSGFNVSLAVKMFDEGALTLGKAAKFANMSHEAFMELLGSMAIPVVKYSADELDEEVEAFIKQ
ncbi:MAG: type II toxin-antitoxin system prevent-host-death family antitoxin [Methylophilaceae bacterium]|nr:type II toxin-antitoxin system prevent-host-death family antitoxin [Methylophilaceae bacterium]